MGFALNTCVLILWTLTLSVAIKFSSESFHEIALLAKEGQVRFEQLREKTNVPQHGSCWKNAISDLQIGCKFLSENVQSDLALKFTDCFLQMSGHEPLICDSSKSACLQGLSDRAFNAYTEFYTHTQSICYFLQSQLWHEETEKTINKLSTTSQQVSQKLLESEKTQEKLLKQQKESLFLQHNLMVDSKNIATVLQVSEEKLQSIMKDFYGSFTEQRKLLLELFDGLMSLKSWAANEVSWFSSTFFVVAATILGFLFTSLPRTKGARIFIVITFSLNYFFERFLATSLLNENLNGSNITQSTEVLNSWIWLGRKFCICLSILFIIYNAINYYDYNALNYHMLLEIKNQNHKILNYFVLQKNNSHVKSFNGVFTKENSNYNLEDIKFAVNNKTKNTRTSNFFNQMNNTLSSSNICLGEVFNQSFSSSQDFVDYKECNENDYNIPEKASKTQKPESIYNLRSKIRKSEKLSV